MTDKGTRNAPREFVAGTPEQAVEHALLYGGAYYAVTRDSDGNPTDLRPVIPAACPCGGSGQGGPGCECDPPFTARCS